MNELNALLLSDGRPGHYHLAEGVIAAASRRAQVQVERLDIDRTRILPTRVLAAMLRRGLPPALALRLGYGVTAANLPKADLVVSAGGDTLAANLACARHLGAANIYCGTLKHIAPEAMSLVISSYASHARLPNHIVTLKPNGLDPDRLGVTAIEGGGIHPGDDTAGLARGNKGGAAIPLTGQNFGPGNAPRRAGLLIGGDSGLFTYSALEWDALLAFIVSSHKAHGIGWIISTSRRTDAYVGDRIKALAAKGTGAVLEFIDFRNCGPGTLPALFARAQVILCSEDSSTMISEAICARRAVVGFAPKQHGFKPDERGYRDYMLANNWCRFMPLAELSPDSFLAALGELSPLRENHLDRLAATLEERLPELFAA